MLTYNNKLKHDSHGFTPYEARQNFNSVDVKLKTELKTKRNINYSDLDVDDDVKIYEKTIRQRKKTYGLIRHILLKAYQYHIIRNFIKQNE